jgi:hypothetical protein
MIMPTPFFKRSSNVKLSLFNLIRLISIFALILMPIVQAFGATMIKGDMNGDEIVSLEDAILG